MNIEPLQTLYFESFVAVFIMRDVLYRRNTFQLPKRDILKPRHVGIGGK